MKSGPSIRTLHQFVCASCGKEEFVRYPYNPLVETPAIDQAVPWGWQVVLDGFWIQTPMAFCEDHRK